MVQFAAGEASFLFAIRTYPGGGLRSDETTCKYHNQQNHTNNPDTCCYHLKPVHSEILRRMRHIHMQNVRIVL